MRPITALIDLAALRNNFARVRACVGAAAKIQAVVKANAYGHGLRRVLPALADADALALIELENALILRRDLGWRKPISLLEGFYTQDELTTFAEHDFAATVHCIEQIEMLERAKLAAPIAVYLKVNSGMNRLGLPIHAAIAAYDRLAALPTIKSIAWMTHFARADEQGGATEPMRIFREAISKRPAPFSAANSAGVFCFDEVGGDFVRPGIMLYGSSPVDGRGAQSLGLQPAMRLNTRVIAIQHVAAGAAVGYGGAFVAQRASRIAVLAGGYGDGYPRHARSGTPIAIAGMRAPLVGRVSMDKITVDVTDLPSGAVGVGTPAQLWGDAVHVDEVAACAGTISYELLTGVTARVAFEVA